MAPGNKEDRTRLWWLLAASLLHFTGSSAQRPLISLYLTQQGVPVSTLALATSIFGLAALLFAYPAGAWADRWGIRPVLLLGSLLMTLGAAWIPFAPVNLISFGIIQALLGVGGILALVGLQSGVTAGSTAENRDHAVATYMFWSSMGQGLGPILGGIAYDYVGVAPAFCIFAGILLLSGLAPVSSGGTGKARGTGAEAGAFSLLRERRVRMALFAGILVISTVDTINTFFPVYGESIGLSATAIGLILGIRAAASMAIRPFQPFIVGRLTRQGAMLWVLVTSAITTTLLGLTPNFAILLVLGVLVGASLGLGQPLSMTEIVDSTPELLRGRALGMRLAGNRLAQMFGPLLYGSVANIGTALVFVGSGLLLAIGAVVTRPSRGSVSQSGD